MRSCYYLLTCFLYRFSIPEYVLKTYPVWVLIGYGIDFLCMETTQAFVAGCAADKCGCNRLFVYTYPRMPRGPRDQVCPYPAPTCPYEAENAPKP